LIPEGTRAPVFTLKPKIPGNVWPVIPDGLGARMLALLRQLEDSQWLGPDALRQRQFAQLRAVLAFAHKAIPFYRDRLDATGISPGTDLTPEAWARLPLLTREDIQDAGPSLRAGRLPRNHGKPTPITTSGSTGKPITTYGTEVTGFFWCAITIREHCWHGRDFSRSLAAIRHYRNQSAPYPEGLESPNWGNSTAMVTTTGPAFMLNIYTPTQQQAEWLARRNPDYLITFPSNLPPLARYCRDNEIRIPNLRQVCTLGEVLPPEARSLCREAWGIGVKDIYSSQEAGYLALQCPDHEHYHVQSENVLLEVLDDDGRPCAPGQTGRVVATSLHNFAMPLLRYDLGDYAEVGDPCPCGRGLPVLTRINGRVRNLLTLPTGEQRWPVFGENNFNDIAPIRQYQIVQKSLETIEVRLVVLADLDDDQEERLRSLILDRLGHPFTLVFSYLDDIPRTASGKFEDFRSEIGT
jgi:phenylacetate-CoA ligase